MAHTLIDNSKATKDVILMPDAKKARELKYRILFTDKILRQKMASYSDGREFSASFGLTPKLDESADRPKNCDIGRIGDADVKR